MLVGSGMSSKLLTGVGAAHWNVVNVDADTDGLMAEGSGVSSKLGREVPGKA